MKVKNKTIMIKLLFLLTLLTSSILITPSSTNTQLTEPKTSRAAQGLKDDDKIAKDFCCIDDSGSITDDTNSKVSSSLLTRCAKATTSAVTSIAKHYILTPKVSDFYNMSETDLDAFIKSKATSSNAYEGYREIETAILDAINGEQLEEAILLFSKISSKKSCFTRTALKTIHEAAGRYQQNIDRAFLQHTLLYATRTARNIHTQDEAIKVKASIFERQTPDSISAFSQKLLEDLRTFATQNTNPAAATLTNNNA
jgi:hypothetical protein